MLYQVWGLLQPQVGHRLAPRLGGLSSKVVVVRQPGVGMQAQSFANTRKSNIGRPGDPTDVALLRGSCGPTTAKVRIAGIRPAPYNTHPTRLHTSAAAVATRRLPTDADSNSAESAASGRS